MTKYIRSYSWLFPLWIGLCCIQPALADPITDPPPQTPEEAAYVTSYNSLLRQGNYAELDQQMAQIQHDYEQGVRSDIDLMHLFRAFYDNDRGLQINLDAWVAAYPQSYVAHEARGIYFRRLAYAARGSNYADQIPRQQIEIMNIYLGKAVADFKIALPLTAKPLLTYFDLLGIAKLLGNRSVADEMLGKAVSIDPRTFIVRYKYMEMLETRWGGSLVQMQAFRAEAGNAGLPDDQMRYLDDLITDEIAWLKNRSAQQSDKQPEPR